jgi:hypothetical protein
MTMGCSDIRESISAFVDGEASPRETAAVLEHLASCRRCRALERQMRAVGAGVRQIRESVPDRFREKVFARLDSEGALPPRKKMFSVSWRWAAVPLAVAAGLGLFLLTSREAVRGPVPLGPATARIETSAQRGPSLPGNTAALSTEDREMLALLDVLEDPDVLDANDEADGMDLLAPGNAANPPDPRRGGRSGT